MAVTPEKCLKYTHYVHSSWIIIDGSLWSLMWSYFSSAAVQLNIEVGHILGGSHWEIGLLTKLLMSHFKENPSIFLLQYILGSVL